MLASPDPDEQVLAAAEHLVDHLAGEVDGRELRHPHVAAGQRLARERVAQLGRGAVDGVTFGHARSRYPRPPKCYARDVGCERPDNRNVFLR